MPINLLSAGCLSEFGGTATVNAGGHKGHHCKEVTLGVSGFLDGLARRVLGANLSNVEWEAHSFVTVEEAN